VPRLKIIYICIILQTGTRLTDRMTDKSIIIKNIGLSFLFVCVFFLVTRNVYHLPFSYGDDHRVPAMLHPEKVSASYKDALYGCSPDLAGSLIKDTHIGRFRPLSWSYDKLLCVLFGDNYQLYRLSNLAILFLSAFFLLCIFTLIEIDLISSLIVLAFYIFGRNNETWWTLIPPPQNIGEMFLLAGIYCWLLYRKKGIRGFYLLPAFLFLLSGISKESFIFCIPVILLTDYFFFTPAPGLFSKEYLFSLFASLLPFLCLLTIVIYNKQVYSYSYPESLLAIGEYNTFQFVGASAFFLAPVVLLVRRWKFIEKLYIFKLISVIALWGIIQLILLKGIKLDDQHHYLIPWLIYPIILTAITLSELRKISFPKGIYPDKWYLFTVIVYCLAILLFIKNTNANSTSYSASLKAYYTMIDTIKKDTITPEVVYLTDHALEEDWIEGTRVIMDNKGIKQELYFATTDSVIPSWEMSYASHSRQNAYRRMPFDSVFYPDGKWIVLVDNPAKNGIIDGSFSFYKRRDSSFVNVNGKEIYIPGKYVYFSVAYPGRSIGDLLKGHFSAENRKGFYAIKLNKGKPTESKIY
jgi:hypothetical protein